MADSETKAEEGKALPTPVAPPPEAKLDDFILLGRYTLIICMLGEFLILNQLGNVNFLLLIGYTFWFLKMLKSDFLATEH